MTPVMFTDSTGMSPETVNVFELIGASLLAIGAITIGVLALTTSVITLPVMVSVFLICAGSATLMDMAVIGRAQYNYSVEIGREDSEIFDDVVNVVGSKSLDKVLYHTTMRVVFIQAEQGVGAAVALLMEANNPSYMVSYTKNLTSIPWITVLTTAYRGYQTGKAFWNSEFAYDYATRMGWTPWEN